MNESVPKQRLSAFQRRFDSIWERATIQEVDSLPLLNTEQSIGAEIHYLKHDLFSLKNLDFRNVQYAIPITYADCILQLVFLLGHMT
jgi:hypothetical protein